MSVNIQSYITTALATAADDASFEDTCHTVPAFANILQQTLEQHQLEATLYPHPDKPFAEIHVNLIEEKWQEEFWWGQSYLEIKISKLAPVFTYKKVMILLDQSAEASLVNSWEHIAGAGEATAAKVIDPVASASGFTRLTSELSQEPDTGSLALNAHYRKWKPTVYAIFFERLTGDQA